MIIIILYFIVYGISFGQLLFIDSIFRENLIETIDFDDIEYSFYNYHVTWEEARIICLDYKSQLAILNTEEKAVFITRKTSESSLAYEEFWIGSKINSQGYWIWTENKNKIIHNQFLEDMIVTPHYLNKSFGIDFYCLTLFRRNHNIPMLIPLRCQEQRPFVCEKDKHFFETNVINVFSTRIKDIKFILYSAKLTWSEAVVQCRQRGFQIAEILNSNQAQSLATGMLRVRPKAIENAWIGGYMENHVWKWLPTEKNITLNEMWQNENMFYGNCLLLDRHVCQLPSYLSAKCDRKRNFFCQTSIKKEFTLNPTPVTLDTCQYWIGFHPLNWFEATNYCEKLKATLVVLDSIITMNHVLNMMIDNRDKLQHIWLDGKKEIKHTDSLQKEMYTKIWKWKSINKIISESGESFIPWCNDSRFSEIDTDCLNMDREDFNIPIVYGVNCNSKQTYICQQWTTSCDAIKKSNKKYTTKNNVTTIKESIPIKNEKINYKLTLSPEISIKKFSKYPLNILNTENSTEQIISSFYDRITIANASSYVTELTEKSINFLSATNKFSFKNTVSSEFLIEKLEKTIDKSDDIYDIKKILKNYNKSFIHPKNKITFITQTPFTPSNSAKVYDKNNKLISNLSDKNVFFKLFSDTFHNSKYLNKVTKKSNVENITIKPHQKNYNFNSKKSSISTIMGFKEIIEMMVKNINTNKSKEIIDSSSNFFSTKLKNYTNNENNIGVSNITKNKPNKTIQKVLVKENILKILKASMNRNMKNYSFENLQLEEIPTTKK